MSSREPGASSFLFSRRSTLSPALVEKSRLPGPGGRYNVLQCISPKPAPALQCIPSPRAQAAGGLGKKEAGESVPGVEEGVGGVGKRAPRRRGLAAALAPPGNDLPAAGQRPAGRAAPLRMRRGGVGARRRQARPGGAPHGWRGAALATRAAPAASRAPPRAPGRAGGRLPPAGSGRWARPSPCAPHARWGRGTLRGWRPGSWGVERAPGARRSPSLGRGEPPRFCPQNAAGSWRVAEGRGPSPAPRPGARTRRSERAATTPPRPPRPLRGGPPGRRAPGPACSGASRSLLAHQFPVPCHRAPRWSGERVTRAINLRLWRLGPPPRCRAQGGGGAGRAAAGGPRRRDAGSRRGAAPVGAARASPDAGLGARPPARLPAARLRLPEAFVSGPGPPSPPSAWQTPAFNHPKNRPGPAALEKGGPGCARASAPGPGVGAWGGPAAAGSGPAPACGEGPTGPARPGSHRPADGAAEGLARVLGAGTAGRGGFLGSVSGTHPWTPPPAPGGLSLQPRC